MEFLDELNRKKAEDVSVVPNIFQPNEREREQENKQKKSFNIFGRIIQTNSMFEYPSISSDEIIK